MHLTASKITRKRIPSIDSLRHRVTMPSGKLKPIDMKKQTSPLSNTTTIPVVETKSFGQSFSVKGEVLTPAPSLSDNVKAVVKPFKSQEELTKLVLSNREVLFGEQSMGLIPKDGDSSLSWDGLLFDFSTPMKPECYLLKTEIQNTDFMGFIASMTKVFAFVRHLENRLELANSIGRTMGKDKRLQNKIEKHYSKGYTIADLLEQTFLRKPQELLLTDDIHWIPLGFASAYPETWGDMLKCIHLQKYQVGKSMILSMNPSFADLKAKPKTDVAKERIVHTEADHLAKASDLSRTIYEKLKADILRIDKSVVFNAKGKHYISVKKGSGKNLAFFHYRKSGIYLVVMLEEKVVRKVVKKAEVKHLSDSAMKFWNGKSTGLVISGVDQLKEVTEVFKRLIKQ